VGTEAELLGTILDSMISCRLSARLPRVSSVNKCAVGWRVLQRIQLGTPATGIGSLRPIARSRTICRQPSDKGCNTQGGSLETTPEKETLRAGLICEEIRLRFR